MSIRDIIEVDEPISEDNNIDYFPFIPYKNSEFKGERISIKPIYSLKKLKELSEKELNSSESEINSNKGFSPLKKNDYLR